MAETLEARFKKAVWLIRNGPKETSSNETKLQFYSFFKQARGEGAGRRKRGGAARSSVGGRAPGGAAPTAPIGGR
jgi:acyl-CoA-binding protein